MRDRIDADLIRAHWDDIFRLMTSLRTRTVSASLMLKQLSATRKQSGLAQALRQMGRIECALFTLNWINDEELRKTTTAELNKGESRNSLVRAVNFHVLTVSAIADRKPCRSGRQPSTWSSPPLFIGIRSTPAVLSTRYITLDKLSPSTCSPVCHRSHGSM